jgi:hypothetical protein
MSDTLESLKSDSIVQFCVFVENKIGRLSQLVKMLASLNIHILAINTLDTNDCSVFRLIVDDPDKTRQHLNLNAFAFCEVEMVCVEMANHQEMTGILTSIANAEINIGYVYPFIYRPQGKCALAFHLDDNDLAKKVLVRSGAKILTQRDITR